MSKHRLKVRFVAVRLTTVAATAAAVVSLWTSIAVTEPTKAVSPVAVSAETEDGEVIEQDGWRWDAARNEWVLIEQPAAAQETAPTVVYVERQPVVYTYTYIQEAPAKGGKAPSLPTGGTQVAVLPTPVQVIVVTGEPEPAAEPAPVIDPPPPAYVPPPVAPQPPPPPPPPAPRATPTPIVSRGS